MLNTNVVVLCFKLESDLVTFTEKILNGKLHFLCSDCCMSIRNISFIKKQKQPSKGLLKVCSKFIGEHACQNVISIKLQSNFIEFTLPHGCSPVNLLRIFRTPFYKNIYEGLFLKKYSQWLFIPIGNTFQKGSKI